MDRPAAASFNPKLFRLGEVLVSRGLIDNAQLAKALEAQKSSGRKLGRALTDLKYVTEAQIAEVVADQLGLRFEDLGRTEVDLQLVARLPEVQARRYRAIPLRETGAAIEVGMVDPADGVSIDQISRALKAVVAPVVVTEGALLTCIERTYQRREEMATFAREVVADIGDGVVSLSGLETKATADDAPVVKLINSIFEAAVSRHASDVHIEPQERSLQIRYRVDGVMQLQSAPDARIAGAVVQRLKLMCNLDISEKRLPQDGRFRVKTGSTTVDIRLSTLPTQFGESVVMRLLVQDPSRLRLDALDLPAPIRARLRAALASTSGMVLVTGPTGSGKTSTLYAALAELNTPDVKIITVEDPVEYRLAGLNQVQVNDKVDLSFSRVLRACLRQDPDIILVGEMRDQETAEIGLRAALTGHLVLSTLHTTSAAAAPMRLRDMGIAPYMVAMGVRLVLAQRLVRTICGDCRTAAEPAAHELEWLGEDAPDGRYACWRGAGCPACHQTGFTGRIAVFEMVEMTPAMVHLANAGDPTAFAAHAAREFGQFTLRRAALDLVAAGRTTLSEAMQVGAAA
jgi:MSHA biogenesis protein MshE